MQKTVAQPVIALAAITGLTACDTGGGNLRGPARPVVRGYRFVQ